MSKQTTKIRIRVLCTLTKDAHEQVEKKIFVFFKLKNTEMKLT